MSYDTNTVKFEGENLLQTAAKITGKPEIVPGLPGNEILYPILILPKGNGNHEFLSLEGFSHPSRKDTKKLLDLKSFLAYVEKFRTKELQIFSFEGNKNIKAIFDYLPWPNKIRDVVFQDGPDGTKIAEPAVHENSVNLDGAKMQHICELDLIYSKRFARWHDICNKRITQPEFAEFLDTNFKDVVKPSGAELLEIALTLEANSTSAFKNAMRLTDGAGQRQWNVDIQTKAGVNGQLLVPEEITICIPIFEGSEPIPLSARLRVRVNDGAAVFTILPNRWDDLIKNAWKSLCADIAEKTGLPVFNCA